MRKIHYNCNNNNHGGIEYFNTWYPPEQYIDNKQYMLLPRGHWKVLFEEAMSPHGGIELIFPLEEEC